MTCRLAFREPPAVQTAAIAGFATRGTPAAGSGHSLPVAPPAAQCIEAARPLRFSASNPLMRLLPPSPCLHLFTCRKLFPIAFGQLKQYRQNPRRTGEFNRSAGTFRLHAGTFRRQLKKTCVFGHFLSSRNIHFFELSGFVFFLAGNASALSGHLTVRKCFTRCSEHHWRSVAKTRPYSHQSRPLLDFREGSQFFFNTFRIVFESLHSQ